MRARWSWMRLAPALILVGAPLLAQTPPPDPATRLEQYAYAAMTAQASRRHSDAAFFAAEAATAARQAGRPDREQEMLDICVRMAEEQHQEEAASDALERLRELDADHSQGPLLRGRYEGIRCCILARQGRTDEARRRIEVALSAVDDDEVGGPGLRIDLLRWLGEILDRAGDPTGAAVALRRALALQHRSGIEDDRLVACLAALATLGRRRGDADTARRCLAALDDLAGRLEPQDAFRALTAAVGARLEGTPPDDVAPCLATARSLLPLQSASAIVTLARLLARGGETERAAACLVAAFDLAERRSDPESMRTLALGLRQIGRPGDAEGAYRRTLAAIRAIDPDLRSYLSMIATEEYSIVLWHLERPDEARGILESHPSLRTKNQPPPPTTTEE